jgi:crossover junction endodeoxyribonuclease RusA
MTDAITLSLPWPDRVISSNGRANRYKKARKVKEARGYAYWVAKEAKVSPWPSASLEFTYHPPSQRGDVHNVASGLKAYIDGIAEAMGVDDRKFTVQYPTRFSESKKGGEIIVKISQAPEQEQ